ncbi:MAG: cytochrome c biogenesis protein ResB [Thermodesulfobacteriota bacterium]|nr:MAG: cytochrome c biogenesis protein ResB [Thermodesulfobacteriota bacterium]
MRAKVNKAAVSEPARKKKKTIPAKIWSFFNSLKLTLGVLLTLAIVSIIGTIIEQNKPIEDYLSSYGPGWTKVILSMGLDNMFHTWWFNAIAGLLTVNIIVCTLERFPPKWKSLLNQVPRGKFSPRMIDNCSHNQTMHLTGGLDATAEKVVGIFKRKKYKVVSHKEDDGLYLYAWKGTIGRFGSDVVHISLLLILIGAIIGGVYGYKDFRLVYEGGTMQVPDADFKVRLDKFWIDYYENGQIRQYNSLLTVMEDGKEVLQKQIWVNEPLYYKGIRFYQSSYGTAWDKVESASIGIVRKDTKSLDSTATIKWGEKKRLPGSEYSVKLIGYTSDFAFDERTRQVFSQSADPKNQAVNLEVYRNGKLISTPWLFLKYPGIFPAIPDSEDDLVFAGYTGIMYSGISLNKGPGTNLVWTGSVIMGLGFILAFFIFHRRVWIYLRETDKSTEIKVGGLINKNQFAFENELKNIVKEIKSDKST